MIRRYGWAVQHVGGGEALEEVPFSYTIGLTAMGHPELVMQGMLPYEHAQVYLNEAGRLIAEGYRFEPGTTDVVGEARCAMIQAEDVSGLVAVEIMYPDRPVVALQLIWTDSQLNFPWDEGYRNAPHVQPLLGPRPARWRERPPHAEE